MRSVELVKQVMTVTVLTVLMDAGEIIWVAILLGMELRCEMSGIADSEDVM